MSYSDFFSSDKGKCIENLPHHLLPFMGIESTSILAQFRFRTTITESHVFFRMLSCYCVSTWSFLKPNARSLFVTMGIRLASTPHNCLNIFKLLHISEHNGIFERFNNDYDYIRQIHLVRNAHKMVFFKHLLTLEHLKQFVSRTESPKMRIQFSRCETITTQMI